MTENVRAAALIGYGRFGAALGQLIQEAGIQLAAYDPQVAAPDGIRAPTAEAALSGASLVILSVPVAVFGEALKEIRPFLREDQLVVDVGSVKRGPEEAMTAVLGTSVPWVATHPLFGPSSIAWGERPLVAVVCPNETHPDAADRAAAFYEKLGCTVHFEDSVSHDRSMAYSHALTFFIAKGMIDIGAVDRTGVVPPSYRAMAQTIDAVRSDAGHLFLAIARENPFASDARKELLQALNRIQAMLADPGVRQEDEQGIFAIPDLGPAAPELRETRDLIDDLDRELVDLIGRRAQLAERAGTIKARHGRGIRDPAREKELLEERRQWAVDEGLDEEAVVTLFEAILSLSRRVQGG